MLLERITRGETLLDRLDPRVRVLTSGVLGILPIFLNGPLALLIVLGLALVLCLLECIPISYLTRRFLAINIFMVMLLVVLPWSVSGEALFEWGSLRYSEDGLTQVLLIACRCNAVMLVFTAFIATMEAVSLAHALDKLHCPQKLVHLFMFTLRYLSVLEDEYRQLRQSMSLRGFRPKLNAHTLRTFGHLTGMMLVRALDRSERIMEAMLCRGYSGKFYTLRHFTLQFSDVIVLVLALLTAVGLLGMDRA